MRTFIIIQKNRTPFDFAEGESELVSGFKSLIFGSRYAGFYT
jgi:NADH:ubiquinone oxidoreductase subunit H